VIAGHETTVDGAKIHWIEEGAGDPPYLLIHGWGSSTVKWRDAMPMLSADRRTVALDLPGFGQSDAPDGTYRPGWLAGAVRAFMDQAGIERAIVIGNSLGGLTGIYLASMWPERVEALIGVSPALPNDGGRPTPKMIASFLAPAVPLVGELLYRRYIARPAEVVVRESLERNCANPDRVSEETRAAMIKEVESRRGKHDHARAVVRANRAMMWALSGRRERTWAVLSGIRVPTLFIWGDQDRLIPPSVGEQAVERLPGSQLIVIDDCGHNAQMECPDEFAASVIAFARSLDARAAGA
jgi:pimeloyl-ACP methyl ester carboxylesterase